LNTIFLEELRQDTEKKAQLQLIKENKKRKREEAKKKIAQADAKKSG